MVFMLEPLPPKLEVPHPKTRHLLEPVIIIIKSRASRQHSKVLYHWEVRRRGKQKSRNKEKVVGFNSASLFPTRKWEAVTQGGTIEQRDRLPNVEKNPGIQYLQRLGG